MTISASTAAKIGGAGTIVAGGTTSVYFGKDYFVLYTAEREAISKSVTLKVAKTTDKSS